MSSLLSEECEGVVRLSPGHWKRCRPWRGDAVVTMKVSNACPQETGDDNNDLKHKDFH